MSSLEVYLLGVLTAVIIGITTMKLILKYLKIIKVNYYIILKNEQGEKIKVINTFDRLYWKLPNAERDIKELLNECEIIRSNYVGGNDYILSLINTQFEVDYKNVYLEYEIIHMSPN